MKHNSYFEGSVQSLGFYSNDNYITIGVIDPGHYSFSTNSHEKVVILIGKLSVKINDELQHISEGNFYDVEKGKEFEVHCDKPVAYICFYS